MYKIIYTFCYALTGNYGIGLIVLSCLAAIGYLPLGRLAVKAQAKEKRINAILKPQLDAIKNEEVDGSKRQSEISRLYKKYRYHPILVVRTAFGVILQLPFLLGAYYMISHFTALEGQTFLFISDLSKPDGLLAGINLLPLVMTLINAGTTLITPNLSLKDRIQAFVIAALFLWLLYGAPSALLFFWTTNNSIFFIQNVIIQLKNRKGLQNNAKSPKKIFAPTLKKETVWEKPLQIPTGIQNALKVLLVSGGAVCMYILFLGVFLLKQEVVGAGTMGAPNIIPDAMCLAFVVIAFVLASILIFARKLPVQNALINLSVCFALWLPVIITYLYIFMNRTLLVFSPIQKGLYLYIFFAGIANMVIACGREKLDFVLTRFFMQEDKKIFFTSLLLLCIIFFFFTPTSIYKSDFSYFDETLISVCTKILPFALVSFLLLTALWYFSSSFWKKLYTIAIFFVFVLSLCNLLIFKGNYGALDFTLLANPRFFSLIGFMSDIFAFFLAALIVSSLFYFKLQKPVSFVLTILLISLSGLTLYNIFSVTFQQNKLQEKVVHENRELQDFYGYSRTEQNVVMFIFDMFDARDVLLLLERNPATVKNLTGFTWYSDTVAIGSNTIFSLPSIYGGYNFTPQNSNKKNKSLHTEINEAYTQLPNLFAQKNFFVSLNHPDPMVFLGNNFFYSKIDNKKNVLLLDPNVKQSSFYRDYLKNNASSKILQYHPYFLAVSLFNVVPHLFRPYIYKQGTWLNTAENINTNSRTLNDLALMKMTVEFANTEKEMPTMKIFYNILSHSNWYLKENELIISEKPQLQLYTEEHILLFLEEYASWLKANGIYDNTRIIVVSDHGTSDYREYSLFAPDSNPFSLLLYKDFNAQHDFLISQQAMTSADAYYLAKNDIFEKEAIPDKTVRKSLRAFHHDIRRHPKKKFLYTEYEVTGPMFDKKNWEKKGE